MTIATPRYFYEIGSSGPRDDALRALLQDLKITPPNGFIPGFFPETDHDDVVRKEIAQNGDADFYYDNRQMLSVDAPIYSADWGGNVHAGPAIVQGSKIAERLISSSSVTALAETGSRVVNLVIADNGLTLAFKDMIGWDPSKEFKDLTIWNPPVVNVANASNKHANMIARVAKRFNPHAVVWDMSILPKRIDDVPSYTVVATAHFEKLLKQVRDDKAAGKDESWVLVCAWSLVSREYEAGVLSYSDDRRHQLSEKLIELVSEGIDVVFAAGNLGQFYPAQGAGHYDTGPFRSIFGANGLPEVLTVGAVDPTGVWIGASSQGPESLYLRKEKDIEAENPPARKPDVCAPSWFFETDDPTEIVTGTSGSCAVAAGVVTAVRRALGSTILSPAELIDKIRQTASGRISDDASLRVEPESWRYGNGVIDCDALVQSLS